MNDQYSEGLYRPGMPDEVARRLSERHRHIVAASRRTEIMTVSHLGRTFMVPPEVYAPSPRGLAQYVLDEVQETDRVLDMGTGSGVNGIVATAKSRDVVAVDISPAAVECARGNAALNGVESKLAILQGDLFDTVSGRFDLIIFDPPFRWFAPQDDYERGMADANYRSLTRFFREVKDYMTRDGRILLAFGTTGDMAYLWHLINESGFEADELSRVGTEQDGYSYAYRLTAESRLAKPNADGGAT